MRERPFEADAVVSDETIAQGDQGRSFGPVADDREADGDVPAPRLRYSVDRDVEAVHVGQRPVVYQLERTVGGRSVAVGGQVAPEISRVGGIMKDQASLGAPDRAMGEQLVDGTIHCDREIGATARPALHVARDSA